MTADPGVSHPAPAVQSPGTSLVQRLVNVAGVLAPTLVLAWLFPARLMFDATTAAGGDLGSHNYAASVARELLLSEHRLTGWVPGNFNGFPLFQMYFPLPFLLIAAASLLFDPLVAFKLGSIAGVLALPAAAYFCVAALKTPFPGPAIGASLVLPFLLQGGNSAWGGNLPSTLAGEFAFSISLPLALIFFGVYDRTFASARGAVAGAVIVALLALTHAYTALWVAAASGLALLSQRPTRGAIVRLALVFAAGGALCAFWLVPLLWYTPWTTAFKHLWVLRSPVEVFPPLLWPALIVALGGPVLLRVLDREAFRICWQSSGLLLAGAGAAALAYLAAPNFGIVDVRFLPFLQLSLCLLAAVSAGHLLSRWAAPALWVPVACLGALFLAQPEMPRLHDWIRWNYEGFERKTFWPVYAGLNQHLRGTAADPRVAYEHSPDHEVLGSVRAFENLPLFSGRSTLEGVNFQASVTAPFVFYVQSEISELMSCPFAEWGCSRPDLGAGIEHLAMMNVSDLILRSTTMKSAAGGRPDLQRTATVGPYEVYRITGHQTGYAVPLRLEPYAVVTPDWKTEAYRWFKRARSTDPLPVFVTNGEEPPGVFAESFDAVPAAGSVPHRSLAGCPGAHRAARRGTHHHQWLPPGASDPDSHLLSSRLAVDQRRASLAGGPRLHAGVPFWYRAVSRLQAGRSRHGRPHPDNPDARRRLPRPADTEALPPGGPGGPLPPEKPPRCGRVVCIMWARRRQCGNPGTQPERRQRLSARRAAARFWRHR